MNVSKKMNTLTDMLIQSIIENNSPELTKEEQLMLEILLEPLFINMRNNGVGMIKKVLLNRLGNRLPHPLILHSFPKFKYNLETKLTDFIERYWLSSNLEEQLKFLYPNSSLHLKTIVNCYSVYYLLPQESLAIISTQNGEGLKLSHRKLLDNACQQKGYRLIKLSSGYLTHQELKRSITRQLLIKDKG